MSSREEGVGVHSAADPSSPRHAAPRRHQREERGRETHVRAVVLSSVVALAMAFSSADAGREAVGSAATSCHGRGAPTASGIPVGTTSCPVLGPGSYALAEGGTGCTLNFVFAGSDGSRYIGTAGHCVLVPPSGSEPVDMEMSWPPGEGPAAMTGFGERFGEFAFAAWRPYVWPPRDFALIRLDAATQVSESLCHWGGPTGLNEDLTDDPTTLRYYGQGVVVSKVVPARTAIATSMMDPLQVWATGVGVPGDSGSAVISEDARAVGVLVAGSAWAYPFPALTVGDIIIMRLGPQLARAGHVLGQDLALRTA